jgi:hypothetical protein
MWIDANVENEIKGSAHNIRNIKYNRKNKQSRVCTTAQLHNCTTAQFQLFVVAL